MSIYLYTFHLIPDKCYMHLLMVLCDGGKLFDGTITRGCSLEKDPADSFRQLPNVVHNGHFMVVMHKELKLESSLLVSKDEYAMQETNFGFHIFIDGVNDFLLSPWPSITNNATALVPTMLPEDTKQRSISEKVIEQPWLQWEEASDKPIDHVVLSKLKQFRVIGNLIKPAIKVIAADFSEEEIKYLKYVFVSMDTNNSGTITYERIKSRLARLASKLSEAKVQQLMQASVLKFEDSFDWITLFLLQDQIRGATSHLARLISLRPDGDANCCTVMLLLPRCQAELWEEKTNYPTFALHLLFAVDKVKQILLHFLFYSNLEDKILFEV
ncbi:calcium-dependent protein kinase 19-like [Nicotiana tabacum]|uniref:Calcium-dependent protein kinase 19-like n=1 Tax=Nicotiana tabacum TaxID=4097 RepID=A0A1S3Y3U1_TOBAC|nr:PREDICTED: calcium-dependent protein kinase-like [Nicotiana tabacum]